MKKYLEILPNCGSNFSHLLSDCLAQMEEQLNNLKIAKDKLLKQTIFLDVKNRIEYNKITKELNFVFEEFYGEYLPPTSFIPQSPCESQLGLEVIYLDSEDKFESIERKRFLNHRILKIEYENRTELFVSGLLPETETDIYTQSKYSFEIMEKILEYENFTFSDVVRQWNYIENILEIKNERGNIKQNYQIFNDVRSTFYNKVSWNNGYPAATGIGADTADVIIDFFTVRNKGDLIISPLKNPKQKDAHQYSEDRLIGKSIDEFGKKSTPKFERGKILSYDDYSEIYISGTAAILGETSVSSMDAKSQTEITINNILELISEKNLKSHQIEIPIIGKKFDYVRVYIKFEKDFEKVKQICEDRFGDVPIMYLIADICREELLVEIEGAITIKH